MKKEGKKLFQVLIIHTITILLLLGTAIAEPMTDPPTFIYSTIVDSTGYSPVNLEFKNYLVFNGQYSVAPDPNEGNLVWIPNAGVRNYTDGPMSFSVGYTGDTAWNKVELYADPSNFEAKLLNDAWSKNGAFSFVNNSSGAVKWFVLKGATNPVNLRADLLFQANLFGGSGPGGSARASFIHFLNITPSPPPATSRFRPLVIAGAVLPKGETCEPAGYVLTSPGFCYLSDGQPHIINNAIRSNPFTVTPDTPFQLQLILNGHASTYSASGVESRATANFFDPKLATSYDFPDITELTYEGFVVDLGGNPATPDVVTLSSLKYKVIPVTMPTISSVDPNRGGDLKTAVVTITGDGFMEGAQVKLARNGQSAIVDNNPVVMKNSITATFDLAGKTRGSWDMVVTNLPAYPEWSVTIPAAFTIEEGIAPQVWMDIVGRTNVSAWGASFQILIGNRGNVDAVGTPIIDGIPKDCLWQVGGLPNNQQPTARPTESGKILIFPTIVVPTDVIVELRLWLWNLDNVDNFKLTAVWED